MGAKDAVVERVAGGVVLRYERWYPHDVDRVWSALTEPDELARWLAAAALDLTLGGEVLLHWLTVEADGEEPVVHGAITALEPPTADGALLEYATDVCGTVRWDLRADHDGCTLALTVTDALTGEQVLRVLTGWHAHLDHLEDALDGTAVDWDGWTPTTRAQASGLSWTDHWTRYSSRLAR